MVWKQTVQRGQKSLCEFDHSAETEEASLVANGDRKLASLSAGVLLEMMRFDFSGDSLGKMVECE